MFTTETTSSHAVSLAERAAAAARFERVAFIVWIIAVAATVIA